MYRILKAEQLADKIYLMDVEAPRVAKSCQPGEFVIVKIDEEGERIPRLFAITTEKREPLPLYFRPLAHRPTEWRSYRQATHSRT